MNQPTLKRRVAQAIEAAGMTKRELARQLGLNEVYVYRLLSTTNADARPIDAQMLARIIAVIEPDADPVAAMMREVGW